MYINSSQKTFVYGTFRWPTRGKIGASLPPPPGIPLMTTGPRDTALEILREFNTSELVGKIYFQVPNQPWVPARPDLVAYAPWYVHFARFHAHTYFDMDGSGLWEVLHFRNESDETGLYVAVALRYVGKTFPWVDQQRERERGN
jgi:hypothetical protein